MQWYECSHLRQTGAEGEVTLPMSVPESARPCLLLADEDVVRVPSLTIYPLSHFNVLATASRHPFVDVWNRHDKCLVSIVGAL